MSSDLEFDNLFKISTRCLRFSGTHPSAIRNTIWKIQFVGSVILLLFCCDMLINSILFHDIQNGNFTEFTKNNAILMVEISVTLKFFKLTFHRDTLNDFIKIINDDYKVSRVSTNAEKDIVLHYCKKGVKVCKYWLICALGNSSAFSVKAITLMIYYYWQGQVQLVHLFDMTYSNIMEEYKNVPFWFWALFTVQFSFDYYCAVIYIGFDPLVPIFMLHTCGQMDILSHRMLNLFKSQDMNEIEEKLKTILKKQQSLYSFMERVKNSFAIIYEFNLKTTTIIVPLCAFVVVEDLRNKQVNIEFIAFFTTHLIEFFAHCYYGDLLMEQSEKFHQAIYSCGWETCTNKRVRKTILFMLTRAGIPMSIRTIFYEINLNTFSEMCRQSYAIFNLMNAAWT